MEDNFDWPEYEKSIANILEANTPLTVTWDLRSMSRIPWEHVAKQIDLMIRIQPIAQDHISKNIILLPNQKWANTLKFLFGVVPPQSPVELHVAKKLPKPMKKGLLWPRSSAARRNKKYASQR